MVESVVGSCYVSLCQWTTREVGTTKLSVQFSTLPTTILSASVIPGVSFDDVMVVVENNLVLHNISSQGSTSISLLECYTFVDNTLRTTYKIFVKGGVPLATTFFYMCSFPSCSIKDNQHVQDIWVNVILLFFIMYSKGR